MVTHIARVWINRVRLPILGLVQSTRFESVSSLLQSPRCNLNLVRLFRFSLALPMFGVFSSFTYTAINLQHPSCTVLYQTPGSSAAVLQSPVMPLGPGIDFLMISTNYDI